MNTLFKINWSEIVIVVGVTGLAALTLVLFFNALISLAGWSKPAFASSNARAKRVAGHDVPCEELDAGLRIDRRLTRGGYADRHRLVWPDQRHDPMNAWSY